ncbi:hypothetical protein [Marinobacterium sediminicola]|uniref:Uncharacterized protein n=1 Tax=Marinobacterium sediminicola TaxID=518898 RepID=A0ABY1S0U4_9GAMM|nr:hypothetical protein [Marinobacterium sediminicola]ULG68412.1 hypothetical protein LN244_11990 [Marinobacterium sediminicola]SMR74708.1 hypothetical protein SAMN04487964_1085 [Marinobacterium sediminicola]
MKHLRKAFTNHRLIRSQPESPQEALLSQADEDHAYLPRETATEYSTAWRRRKPTFPSVETHTVPGMITLWDENNRIKDGHV